MGEVIDLNRCENCGGRIGRDYGRKVPTWVHLDTGSRYCDLREGGQHAEPRD